VTLARVAIHATTDTDAEHIARQRFAKLDPDATIGPINRIGDITAHGIPFAIYEADLTRVSQP
jgi:hypothetical protein